MAKTTSKGAQGSNKSPIVGLHRSTPTNADVDFVLAVNIEDGVAKFIDIVTKDAVDSASKGSVRKVDPSTNCQTQKSSVNKSHGGDEMKGFKLNAADAAIIQSLSEDDQTLVNKMLERGLFEQIFSIPLNKNYSYGMGEENERKFLICADLKDAKGKTHRFLFASRKDEGDFEIIQFDVYHMLTEIEHRKLICFCAKEEAMGSTLSF